MDNLEEMDKFLKKYNFPKLNQGEIENPNTGSGTRPPFTLFSKLHDMDGVVAERKPTI